MTAVFHTVYDISSGDTWIADRSHRIARLTLPKLSDIVFHPGGDPLVTWITLFWWQYSNNELPGRSAWILDEFSINEQNPECYRLYLRSHNTGNQVESSAKIELTYDSKRNSYLYKVSTQLEVQSGKEWVVTPQCGVEFVNPWLRDAVGTSVELTNAVSPRWNWILYSDLSGKIRRIPLNHLGSPHLENLRFPTTGGWLGFFYHFDGNPIIELDKETSQNTWAEVCAWGYDVHFVRQLLAATPSGSELTEPETPIILKSGQKLFAKYHLYSVQADEGEYYYSQSEQPNLEPKEVDHLTRPAYLYPKNTFFEGIYATDADNRWYWAPSHDEGVYWDRMRGRTGGHSLHIQNKKKRRAYWEVSIGKDFWMNPLPEAPQKIICWIHVENVKGTGAYFTFRFSNYKIETGLAPIYGEFKSTPLTGSINWVKFELLVPSPPPDATRAYLRLILDGTGDVWFDDILLESDS